MRRDVKHRVFLFKGSDRAGTIELARSHRATKDHGVQDVINFLYTIRGELFYWSLMGLVLIWICDLFGLWERWGR